jgi:pimeloyl-ACP methyl ester carboxylesterase
MQKQRSEKMWQRKSVHIHFKDEDMDFNLFWALANVAHRGAEIGEIFYIANRIKDGDPASWAYEWTQYAAALEQTASALEQKGHVQSAGEIRLRAFTYYRTGSVGQRPSQPESRSTYDRLRHCFRRGVQLLNLPVEAVEVPYRGITLSGYFSKGMGNGPRPTIITTHGGEMFSEDLFFWIGRTGMQRGYNILSLDTPGGPGIRFIAPDQHVRPYFEGGIQTLSDYALSRSETDPKRVAVMGFSGGGYFGMRLTSLDKRINALIASAPIYDLYALAASEFPPALQKAPAFVGDALLKVAASLSPMTKVAMERVLWASGVNRVSELLALMKEAGAIDPHGIDCPVLCLTGEGESKMQNAQAQHVFETLRNARKAFYLFKQNEGADAHCQVNNLTRLQEVTFDWLDDIFDLKNIMT